VTVVALLVILGILIPRTIKSDIDETTQVLNPIESLSYTPTIDEVKRALVYAAEIYGLNESQLLRVANCESGFKYTAVGKAGEIGILQFMPSTWEYWNKELGVNYDIYSSKDQIYLVAWAWNNGYQNHWTCFFKNY